MPAPRLVLRARRPTGSSQLDRRRVVRPITKAAGVLPADMPPRMRGYLNAAPLLAHRRRRRWGQRRPLWAPRNHSKPGIPCSKWQGPCAALVSIGSAPSAVSDNAAWPLPETTFIWKGWRVPFSAEDADCASNLMVPVFLTRQSSFLPIPVVVLINLGDRVCVNP